MMGVAGPATGTSSAQQPVGEPPTRPIGPVYHVAFRVQDDEAELFICRKLLAKGRPPISPIDHDYFHLVFFREPGGVPFEITPETPDFAVDKSLSELGNQLRLPQRHEHRR